MEKRWNIKPSPDAEDVISLSKALGDVHPVFARLLLQRGISTAEQAHAFFNPKLVDMHNPFLMQDMEEAVERINDAIERGEGLLVYGDYDVDGATAVALVYSYLKPHFGEDNIDYYIPDRYDEGSGISQKGIDYAAERGLSLIIALDCGIKAVSSVEYAKQKGIDVIICDHHTSDGILPEAVACLDPKRSDCHYPDKNLSGCGVGFKLMQAFCRRNDCREDDLLQYLDILAVSIASDIVPMMGENRILAHYGLKKINENPSVGLKSIINVAGLKHKTITISDIVFKIGPRINAAGRMQSANEAVKLLICDNDSEAEAISNSIDAFNDARKDLDRAITKEALKMLKERPDIAEGNATILFNPLWHKGVIGIVASRLTEICYKPTIILTESNGFATGSARSIDGFDIYNAIGSCSDLLENFGGHMYAAGLTLKIENIGEFTRRFDAYVAANIDSAQLEPQIDIDAELHLSDITPEFYTMLNKFEPYGPLNPKPVFMSSGVYDFGTSKAVGRDIHDKTHGGKTRKHIKLEVTDNHSRGTMQGVAFGLGNRIADVKSGLPLSICYTIEMNNFRNKQNLQLMVSDLRPDKK
ncbi:MAG: single-stranded-DNA-specific exonuclease RecJ [Bacteroidales bacterium]|nr:single-stranded-DNA-specific exonuclease RecJ [Bacteroidales bacterium]